MKKDNSKTILISGFVAVIVTIIFYLLAFDNIFTLPMRWLSLLCLLGMELLGTIKAVKVNKSIWGETIITISLFHLAVVLVLSLVFVNVLPLLLKQYVLLNLLLLASVALLDILLVHFESKAIKSNGQYAESSSVIDECLIKAQGILMEIKSQEYKKSIEDVIELLRYSNRTALCGNEDKLIEKLDELGQLVEADDTDAIKNASKTIQNMLKLRTVQLKKIGSF